MARRGRWLAVPLAVIAATTVALLCFREPRWSLERTATTNSTFTDSAMTQDGRYYVKLAQRELDPRRARAALYNTISGDRVCNLPRPEALVGRLLHCSADGTRLVAVEPLSRIIGGERRQAAASIASWSVVRGEFLGDGCTSIWDVPPDNDPDARLAHFDIAPNAAQVAISLGSHVHILDLSAGDPDAEYAKDFGAGDCAHTVEYARMEMKHTFVLDRSDFAQAQFSHDGTRVVAWGRLERIEIWDLGTGRSLRTRSAPSVGESDKWAACLTWPRGLFVSSTSLFAWDWETGRRAWTTAIPDQVRTLTWSPDRTKIVTTQLDDHARAWSMEDGEAVLAVRGRWDHINNAALVADGSHLVMSCWDADAGVAMVDVFKRNPSGGPWGVFRLPGFWAVPVITAVFGLGLLGALRHFTGKAADK